MALAQMTAITGSTAGIRDLADNTLRLTIEIEPQFAKQAFELFGTRGTEVAIAALKPIHQRGEIVPPVVPPERPKVGPACSWLVMRAKDPRFQEWLISKYDQDRPQTEADVAALIRQLVHVESRSDIDGDIEAEGRFETYIRQPWLRFNQEVTA